MNAETVAIRIIRNKLKHKDIQNIPLSDSIIKAIQLILESNSAVIRFVIGLEKSYHFLNQSEATSFAAVFACLTLNALIGSFGHSAQL